MQLKLKFNYLKTGITFKSENQRKQIKTYDEQFLKVFSQRAEVAK